MCVHLCSTNLLSRGVVANRLYKKKLYEENVVRLLVGNELLQWYSKPVHDLKTESAQASASSAATRRIGLFASAATKDPASSSGTHGDELPPALRKERRPSRFELELARRASARGTGECTSSAQVTLCAVDGRSISIAVALTRADVGASSNAT